MAPNDDTIFLKSSVDVLSFFNEDQLRRVTPDIERHDYRAGQTVIMRGEVSSGFYIIKKGRASAAYKTAGGTVNQELKVGDFFGVITLLQDMPSDAAVKAVEDDTTILTIPADSFRKLLEMQPLLKKSLLDKAAQARKPPQK
jgi:CRP-like cAMP-binding protein